MFLNVRNLWRGDTVKQFSGSQVFGRNFNIVFLEEEKEEEEEEEEEEEPDGADGPL